MDQSAKWWRRQAAADSITFVPIGSWRMINLKEIAAAARHHALPSDRRIIVDGSELQELDTAGAMLLLKMVLPDIRRMAELKFVNLEKRHDTILELVRSRLASLEEQEVEPELGVLAKLGRATTLVYEEFRAMVNFIGHLSVAFAEVLMRPRLARIKEFFVQLELVCLDAIPVTALVTFLIGVVVAYLYSMQAEKYGANIFIVDGIGFAMCRELSPIIAAIIAAGRSGSAFTAQIGTMKLNEEVDALVTLGLSPQHVLVLPRVAALMVAMPLLVFVGDLLGIGGGMLIAQRCLSISPRTFLDRMQVVLYLRHVFVGWSKAPVFALFIAMIGCRQGLSVENNTRSVGLKTTSTVVRAIVSVIILNAIFAVTYARLGI